jgi:hypothetical protein
VSDGMYYRLTCGDIIKVGTPREQLGNGGLNCYVCGTYQYVSEEVTKSEYDLYMDGGPQGKYVVAVVIRNTEDGTEERYVSDYDERPALIAFEDGLSFGMMANDPRNDGKVASDFYQMLRNECDSEWNILTAPGMEA